MGPRAGTRTNGPSRVIISQRPLAPLMLWLKGVGARRPCSWGRGVVLLGAGDCQQLQAETAWRLSAGLRAPAAHVLSAVHSRTAGGPHGAAYTIRAASAARELPAGAWVPGLPARPGPTRAGSVWTSSPRLLVGLLLRVGPAWGTRSDSLAPLRGPGLGQSRSCECRERCWQALGRVPRGDFGSEVGIFSVGVMWVPGSALAWAPVAWGPVRRGGEAGRALLSAGQQAVGPLTTGARFCPYPAL